jgi:hypothetical protein
MMIITYMNIWKKWGLLICPVHLRCECCWSLNHLLRHPEEEEEGRRRGAIILFCPDTTRLFCIVDRRFTYIHTYHSHFIPEGVSEVSQIFLQDTQVLPKLVSNEETPHLSTSPPTKKVRSHLQALIPQHLSCLVILTYTGTHTYIIIIIISPLQSTAGHRPLQLLAISLDLRLFAKSSCQPSCANRHCTWPEGVLHYVYLDRPPRRRRFTKNI